MKEKIIKFGKWAQHNWLALIIILAVVMMSFLCAVMFSWLYGYWSNAIAGTKFELSSCWTGITVVATGLGGIVALAKACWTKYGMDSQYNSAQGKAPTAALAADVLGKAETARKE